MLNGKFSERLAQLGAPPPAEDEATGLRKIKAAARRLGASTNLAVAAIAWEFPQRVWPRLYSRPPAPQRAHRDPSDTDSRARLGFRPGLPGGV